MVPYPAGGPVDVTARLIAQSVGNSLGQPIAVDNRGGGAGVIGSVAVQHAEPDGHTLILGTNQTHATNQSLLKNCPYDAVKDFAPVAGLADIPHVLVVRRGLEAENVGALVALARKSPGELNYASTGVGSASHLAAELFKTRAGVGPAAHPVPRLGADDHRALGRPRRSHLCDAAERDRAISTPARFAHWRWRAQSAPRGCRHLPTLAEAGVTGVEADAWFALFAPANTPAATIERLYSAVSAGLTTDAARESHRHAGHDTGAALASRGGRLAAGRGRQMGGGDQGGRRRRGVSRWLD